MFVLASSHPAMSFGSLASIVGFCGVCLAFGIAHYRGWHRTWIRLLPFESNFFLPAWFGACGLLTALCVAVAPLSAWLAAVLAVPTFVIFAIALMSLVWLPRRLLPGWYLQLAGARPTAGGTGRLMSSTIHRLAGADGLSLEVPGAFREAPELERGPVRLAAHADPWPWPHAFRPNLTAEVTELAPDRATVPQLSALTIAAQIALGAHVAACDIWPGSGAAGWPPDHLAVSGAGHDRRPAAIRHDPRRPRDHRVGSARRRASRPGRGHLHARGQHDQLRLRAIPAPGRIRRRCPGWTRSPGSAGWRSSRSAACGRRSRSPAPGRALDDAQLEAIRGGKPKRASADLAALQAAGLVTERGRLTDLGEAAHRALSSPARQVTIEVVADDDPRVAVLRAYQTRAVTAVVASPPAGVPGSGSTLDVIPSQTTPIALARWIGLAPAWTFGIAADGESTLPLDAELLGRPPGHVRRPGTPPVPPPASALARMWAQPWQVAKPPRRRVRCACEGDHHPGGRRLPA